MGIAPASSVTAGKYDYKLIPNSLWANFISPLGVFRGFLFIPVSLAFKMMCFAHV